MKYLLIAILIPIVGRSQLDTVRYEQLVKSRSGNILLLETEPFHGVTVRTEENGTTTYITYANGLKDGPFREIYSNQKTKSIGNYTNGKEEGVFIYFNEAGDTIQSGGYRHGKAHGPWYTYFKDDGIYWYRQYEEGIREGYWLKVTTSGDTLASGNYFLDHKIGSWKVFDASLQQMVTYDYLRPKAKKKTLPKTVTFDQLWQKDNRWYYENVPYTGVLHEKYEDGQTKQRITYKKGQIRSQEMLFQNGKRQGEFPYKKGRKHGIWVFYSTSGIKSQSIDYKNGLKEGESWYYNSKGLRSNMTTYKNDIRHGPRYEWSDLNPEILKVEMNYENGQLHGPSKRYSNDGFLVEERMYQQGELKGPAVFYNEKGEQISESQYLQNYAETSKSYYPSGKLKSELKQIKDHKQFYVEYYETGELKERGIYKHGKKEGNWDRYLRNGGNIVLRTSFEAGEIGHAALLNVKEYDLYSYDYPADSSLQAFVERIEKLVDAKDVETLWSLVADAIFTDVSDIQKGERTNTIELKKQLKEHSNYQEYLLTLFQEATKTGIKESPQLAFESTAGSGKMPVYMNHHFRLPDLDSAYQESLTLSIGGGLFPVYAAPISTSRPLGMISGYPQKVEGTCSEEEKSTGDCWHKIRYDGKTGYIKDLDVYDQHTAVQVFFQKIDGNWKIIGWF